MIEQRTVVDPVATRLQDLVDDVQITSLIDRESFPYLRTLGAVSMKKQVVTASQQLS